MRRMRLTLRLLLKSLFLILSSISIAQKPVDKGCKPPIGRVLWHDRIDREQRNTLKADGRADARFEAGNNEDLNYFITQAITIKVDNLQCQIEKDTLTGDQKKKAYLSGIEKMLRNFSSLYRSRQFNAAHFPSAIDAFEAAMERDLKKETIEPVIERNSYDVGRLLLASNAFDDNAGYARARNNVLLKFCVQNPDQ